MSPVTVILKPDDVFGPVLYAEGLLDDGLLKYGIVCGAVVCPTLVCKDAASVSLPRQIAEFEGILFYRWDILVAPEAELKRVSYAVNGQGFSFYIPAAEPQREDFRLAYVSCNGSEADSPGQIITEGQYGGWTDVAEQHERQPFSILLHGGDQIYADRLWQETPVLKKWLDSGADIQSAPIFDKVLREQVRQYYFRLYMQVWTQPQVAQVLAAIPSLMIWDDHDIFDGWGSWEAYKQASPLYQGIFLCALEAFFLFQRGQEFTRIAGIPSNFHLGKVVRFAGYSIITPDLRSQRTRESIMAPNARQWLDETLAKCEPDSETIIVFSVPLATGHFSALDFILTNLSEDFFKWLPAKLNPKRFADDIHDQWRIPAHRDEWVEMIKRLLDHQQNRRSRVTLLSGEIHMGARSTIATHDQAVIAQYISSGIAHPPMPKIVVFFCEWLSKGWQEITDALFIRMEKIYPTGRRRYIASRNWLSLRFTPRRESIATWHTSSGVSVTHER